MARVDRLGACCRRLALDVGDARRRRGRCTTRNAHVRRSDRGQGPYDDAAEQPRNFRERSPCRWRARRLDDRRGCCRFSGTRRWFSGKERERIEPGCRHCAASGVKRAHDSCASIARCGRGVVSGCAVHVDRVVRQPHATSARAIRVYPHDDRRIAPARRTFVRRAEDFGKFPGASTQCAGRSQPCAQ